MSGSLIVQKYGGSSLGSPERIKAVAARIAASARRDNRIIVIVSAMGKTTDELLMLAREISPRPRRRELDMLLTVGERIAMALLSMALNDFGIPAISFTGSQSGIVTSSVHTGASIEEIRGQRIEEALRNGRIAIVAGFQGVSRRREITTLGRGGSDTTAVALAGYMNAVRCEIYSDFPGLFTADPRFMKSASIVPRISHDEMLELASLGAEVLHFRAAGIARKYKVQLFLLSSFDDSEGTVVEGEPDLENLDVKSITCLENVGMIAAGIEDGGTADSAVAGALRIGGIRPLFYQRSSVGGRRSVLCIVDGRNFEELESAFDSAGDKMTILEAGRDYAVVSAVGSWICPQSGRRSNGGKSIGRRGHPHASGLEFIHVGILPPARIFLPAGRFGPA